MDQEVSTKFMASLAEMMQYCCNKYIDFEHFTLVTGSFYLNIDDGEKTEFILNEKLCTTERNRVIYLSNSYPSTSPGRAAAEKFPCLDMQSGESLTSLKACGSDVIEELHTPAPPNMSKLDGQQGLLSCTELDGEGSQTNNAIQVIEPKKEAQLEEPTEASMSPARPLRKRKLLNYNVDNYDSTQSYIEEQADDLLHETSASKRRSKHQSHQSLSETISLAVKEAVGRQFASLQSVSGSQDKTSSSTGDIFSEFFANTNPTPAPVKEHKPRQYKTKSKTTKDGVKKSKNHICEFCQKGFLNNIHLQRHRRIHTGEKPHVCTTCGRGFSDASHLKYHESTHTGEMNFECDICGKAIYSMYQLKIHKRKHTGERPFVCSICGKGFSVLGSLRNHTLSHSGEKSHTCDVCGKGFTLPGHLKRHRLIHTTTKPLKCEGCNKLFRKTETLKNHKCQPVKDKIKDEKPPLAQKLNSKPEPSVDTQATDTHNTDTQHSHSSQSSTVVTTGPAGPVGPSALAPHLEMPFDLRHMANVGPHMDVPFDLRHPSQHFEPLNDLRHPPQHFETQNALRHLELAQRFPPAWAPQPPPHHTN